MLWLKLNHVSKTGIWPQYQKATICAGYVLVPITQLTIHPMGRNKQISSHETDRRCASYILYKFILKIITRWTRWLRTKPVRKVVEICLTIADNNVIITQILNVQKNLYEF